MCGGGEETELVVGAVLELELPSLAWFLLCRPPPPPPRAVHARLRGQQSESGLRSN